MGDDAAGGANGRVRKMSAGRRRLGVRGMSLAGRAIDLERGKNELRIDGLGEATLPIRAPAARPLDTSAPGLVGMMPAAPAHG